VPSTRELSALADKKITFLHLFPSNSSSAGKAQLQHVRAVIKKDNFFSIARPARMPKKMTPEETAACHLQTRNYLNPGVEFAILQEKGGSPQELLGR
jgi:hypothetical protein